MRDYTQQLVSFFHEHGNTEVSLPMKKYMKDHFEFLGIRSPERKKLLQEFLRVHGKPTFHEYEKICLELWAQPEREFQYNALELLRKYRRKFEPSTVSLLETLIITKSWWDTVDHIASDLVGFLFQKHPDLIPMYTEKWLGSQNIWLQRTVILFQLKYKEKTDLRLLYQAILACKDSKEFFIQKAIGWALREYSKINSKAIVEFVESHTLAPLSKREALKRIDFPQGDDLGTEPIKK
ncbi:3-methyladenine DNA glycosylase AlkD [Marininema mesophilum]|uniref:3-methyladenine DNA glycosylase AlkD n=1 Tax=Marininema mesophilum TaxID=1048340 RepID=A0A1H2YZS9_9BACL|nr:DNA alkylation repair protein [Marininema mesophilum]SDX10154.1 3-methyladenine DNA glycosylase AlkD [Marininema mesophilum]